jgi:nicotinic acetylcholine receptor alpha-7
MGYHQKVNLRRITLFLIILCSGFNLVGCADTYDKRIELVNRLLTNYSRHIRPLNDQTKEVRVLIEPLVKLIIDFDETAGVFSWYGNFEMLWKDERITWNVSENAGISSIDLPVKNVWVPKVIIGNSAKKRTFFAFDNEFDYETSSVKYLNDGSAFLEEGGVIDTSCDADITYYPADNHICDIILYGERNEMIFSSHDGLELFEIVLGNYLLDSEWDITNVTHDVFENVHLPTIVFNYHIQRKPLFIITNMVMPIVLLGVLNIFTFVLPIESGERTSFAVTLFLTFVVVMTVVSETLPATDKMGYFSIFLILRIVTSALATMLTIFSISLYYKEENSRICCRRLISHPIGKTEVDAETPSSNRHYWRNISYLMDNICTVCFVFEFFIEFIVMLSIFYFRND